MTADVFVNVLLNIFHLYEKCSYNDLLLNMECYHLLIKRNIYIFIDPLANI